MGTARTSGFDLAKLRSSALAASMLCLWLLYPASPLEASVGRDSTDGQLGQLKVEPTRVQTLVPIGKSDQALVLHNGQASHDTLMVLPLDTRQGSDSWWIVRLRVSIYLESVLPPGGEYLVNAATNGREALRIRVKSRGDGIIAQSEGIIGRAVGQGRRSLSLTAENYVQSAGVKPGENRLRISVKDVSGAVMLPIRVHVEEGSGLARTTVSPNEVGVGTVPSPVGVYVGEETPLPYFVGRQGGRPDGRVQLFAASRSNSLTVTPTQREFPTLGPGQSGSVAINAAKAGEYVVALGVLSDYNQPMTSVRIVATERPSVLDRVPVTLLYVLAVGLMATVGGVVGRRLS